MIGIYKITNPNGLIYIGQSSDIEKRFKQYKRYACQSQTKLYNSLKKYGYEAHKFEVICECSIDNINELEKYYGDLYECIVNGLNLKECGGNRQPMSEETKKRMSKPRNLTEEQRIVLSNRMKVLHKGVKKSDECKRKVSESKIGVKRSQELKNKLSKLKCKPFAIYNDWILMEFESVTKACEFLKCSRKEVSKAFKSSAIYKGYKLMYI